MKCFRLFERNPSVHTSKLEIVSDVEGMLELEEYIF